jgi:segregation and condensation protein B
MKEKKAEERIEKVLEKQEEQKKVNRLAFLEAILFTTHEPLSVKEIAKIIRTTDLQVEKLLQQIKEKYHEENSGIMLSDVGGFKLAVKTEYVAKVSHLTPHAELSRGLLRVLSIIVYHEPVPQSEIVKVIGNRTYEYVKELEERGLVKSEKKSRTKMLSVTEKFEEYFGVKKEEIKKIAQG